MGELRFEWDPAKDAANQRKHGIAFVEAETSSATSRPWWSMTPDHSDTEERFILLGLSATLRALVMVHCYREEDDVIRLIAARKASRPERARYTARWQP